MNRKLLYAIPLVLALLLAAAPLRDLVLVLHQSLFRSVAPEVAGPPRGSIPIPDAVSPEETGRVRDSHPLETTDRVTRTGSVGDRGSAATRDPVFEPAALPGAITEGRETATGLELVLITPPEETGMLLEDLHGYRAIRRISLEATENNTWKTRVDLLSRRSGNNFTETGAHQENTHSLPSGFLRTLFSSPRAPAKPPVHAVDRPAPETEFDLSPVYEPASSGFVRFRSGELMLWNRNQGPLQLEIAP